MLFLALRAALLPTETLALFSCAKTPTVTPDLKYSPLKILERVEPPAPFGTFEVAFCNEEVAFLARLLDMEFKNSGPFTAVQSSIGLTSLPVTVLASIELSKVLVASNLIPPFSALIERFTLTLAVAS